MVSVAGSFKITFSTPDTDMMRAMVGPGRFFYVLYFQTAGVAEHELQHDVEQGIRRFLYGASGNAPEREFDLSQVPADSAYFLENIPDCDELPPWLTQADLDYFVHEFERNGFRGPLNWYRNFDRNWELAAPFQGQKITVPAAFISGDRDLIRMNPMWEQGLRAVCSDLRSVSVLPGIGHWTQQEAPDAVNDVLVKFLGSL